MHSVTEQESEQEAKKQMWSIIHCGNVHLQGREWVLISAFLSPSLVMTKSDAQTGCIVHCKTWVLLENQSSHWSCIVRFQEDIILYPFSFVEAQYHKKTKKHSRLVLLQNINQWGQHICLAASHHLSSPPFYVCFSFSKYSKSMVFKIYFSGTWPLEILCIL